MKERRKEGMKERKRYAPHFSAPGTSNSGGGETFPVSSIFAATV
jgi:hypothetical protein